MLLVICALLSVLLATNCVQASANATLTTCICDGEVLRSAVQKLQQLEIADENLRLKMDTLNMIMIQEFSDLKATAMDRTQGSAYSKHTEDTCGRSYENLIDVRSNLADKTGCKSSEPSYPHSHIPRSCAEAVRLSGRPNGIHKVRIPDSNLKPFFVYCMTDPLHDGVAWTLVQRRVDGSIDFQRTWSDYQRGFGNLEGEFFIGLEKLHALTRSTVHELWIQLEDFENSKRWAKYSSFAIGDASESFALSVLGSYTGDAGDSLIAHAGQKFTTKDVDNDSHKTGNCAVLFTGAWWYNQCHESNLNGQYLRGSHGDDNYGKGIDWYKWKGHTYSLKYVHMAIRATNLDQ